MTQKSNKSVTRNTRVSPTFNPDQIKLINELVGVMGDNQADVNLI